MTNALWLAAWLAVAGTAPGAAPSPSGGDDFSNASFANGVSIGNGMLRLGGDDQAPILFRMDRIGRPFGLPFVPVTPTFPLFGLAGLLPLPVKYRIRYGEPFHFYRDHPKEAARNPALVEELADQVRARVQEMVDAGVKARSGVFV